MATVAKGGTLPDTGVTKNEIYALVDNATVTAIANADISASAAIADSKLATISTAGKVSGAALTSLSSVPSAAGVIPVANLGSGTPSAATVLLGDGSWGSSGLVVQYVYTQYTSASTGTTAIPYDDTIPQITEGDEYMTQAITPKSATNLLKIDVVWSGDHSAACRLCAALFVGTTANALACSWVYSAGGEGYNIAFSYTCVAGSTDARTYRVRVGGSTGSTTTFNGMQGVSKYGAITKSSITITEYTA